MGSLLMTSVLSRNTLPVTWKRGYGAVTATSELSVETGRYVSRRSPAAQKSEVSTKLELPWIRTDQGSRVAVTASSALGSQQPAIVCPVSVHAADVCSMHGDAHNEEALEK